MIRLVHLSDLHFGLHRAALEAELLARVNAAGADLIVLTGDLTHRGRSAQYALARRFLDRLAAPWMAVPGNHDVPLRNIPERLAAGWARWRAGVDAQTSPVRRVGGQVRVFGLNSVDVLAWQRGTLRGAEIDDLVARMAASAAEGVTSVVALHHPLAHRPGVDKALTRGATAALGRLAGAGGGILLSGHLHVWSAGTFPEGAAAPLLHLQAGTALCGRATDLRNEFAVLDLDGERLEIARHVAPMDAPGFGAPERLAFRREAGLWRRVEPGR